ncbi:MAG: FHA domain-containing protein [Anaerolineales bacterium]|nr:MAG: FHA domain-containing protein [Anaerolineales bacterium]
MKRFLLALTLLLAAVPYNTAAQTGARITLRSVQTNDFPSITGYFDAQDASGARITDLTPEQLQMLEDGVAQPIQHLRNVQIGLRVIMVVTPAESFGIRDGQGTARIDYIKQAIRDWASTLSSTSDTLLTLVTPEGTLVNNGILSEWQTALDGVQAPPGTLYPDLQALANALAIAAQPAPDDANTAIWWVTTTPRLSDIETAAPDFMAQLDELGVPLVIWQVDSPSLFENEASQLLLGMAENSAGQRLQFSGTQTLSSPAPVFAPLRSAYFFQYYSQLRRSGEHELVMQAQGDGLTSQPFTISLQIQPPNPILVSPPTQIARGPAAIDPQLLSPFSQPIELLVEFPDGFERNVVRSTLYVNDEIVAENTTAPFTHFAWDLKPYNQSQQIFLRAEVQDELGLIGESIDFPVEISVQAPATWFQALLSRAGSTLAFSVVLIAAGAFFLVMVLSGRLDPVRLNRIFARDRRSRTAPRPMVDPLNDSPLGMDEVPHLQDEPDEEPVTPATLQRLAMQDPSKPAQVLPLSMAEVTIGSGPTCTLILSEPSVDKQHSRITQDEMGDFHIADMGSHAGTWVNYAPVSSEGSHLQDGDIVHIGRVAFRFLLTK